jgi:hypothetical protein
METKQRIDRTLYHRDAVVKQDEKLWLAVRKGKGSIDRIITTLADGKGCVINQQEIQEEDSKACCADIDADTRYYWNVDTFHETYGRVSYCGTIYLKGKVVRHSLCCIEIIRYDEKGLAYNVEGCNVIIV